MELLSPPETPAGAASNGERPSEGHGRRLTAAFDALESFPVLSESRNRVLRLIREKPGAVGEVVAAIESDVALVTTVLRVANSVSLKTRGKIDSVPKAVEALTPGNVERLVASANVFDFFERTPGWDGAPERFRIHAVATQTAAERVARELDFKERDELLTSALLHDIGKLVLTHAYAAYPAQIHGSARTPEERVHAERRELGVDHGLVGGVLARRWGLPGALASAIERHHAEDATGQAAIVRLADMLAHYGHGETVDPKHLLNAARALGLRPESLRNLMYEIPYASSGKRHVDPCPLSSRELDVLKKLAQGKVYKQIALELALSTSTVRTHLHNTYAKLDTGDRAQAVLLATDRGWL